MASDKRYSLFFSDHDQGHSYLIDTSFWDEQSWLVGSWLQSHATLERTPETLVCLTGLNYQQVEGQQCRFVLNGPVPKSVLDGKENADYVVCGIRRSETSRDRARYSSLVRTNRGVDV